MSNSPENLIPEEESKSYARDVIAPNGITERITAESPAELVEKVREWKEANKEN